MRDAARSVRLVRHAVRHRVRHQTLADAGLCGLCGNSRALMGESLSRQIDACTAPHVRLYAAHAAHAAQPTIHAVSGGLHAAHPNRTYRTPLCSPVLLKKEEVVEEKEEKAAAKGVLQCGPENVGEFNARLRSEAPAFYALAKALHARGMIDGFRGARIGPAGSLDEQAVPVELSGAAEGRLKAKQPAEGRRG